MYKNLLPILAIILLAIITFPSMAQANAMETQQAKIEHMRACLSNGGKRDICSCSFDRALTSMSTKDLIEVNRALTNKIPANPKHLDTLARITRRCVKDISEGKYNPEAEAAAQTSVSPTQTMSFDDLNDYTIPAPPPLQKSAPSFSEQDTEGYFDEEEIDEAAQILAAKQAERARQASQVRVNSLKETYRGQYDQLFFQAAGKGDMQAMQAIIQYLPRVDILDKSENTPLMIAAAAGQTRAINFLIANKANLNHRNKQGQQAIHVATFHKQQEVVWTLLKNKVDVNSVYGPGFAPLHLAIMVNEPGILQSLIISGAKVVMPLTDGNLPIHIAATTNSPQAIEILKNYGANLNAENPQGYTPLLIAASQNNVAAASTLLALGADYNFPDIYGRTPLQLAASFGHQEIVNLILTVKEQRGY